MTDMLGRISELEKDVGVIQKENEIQTRVFFKFEETIEKLQDLTESMHRLISIHDIKIENQEEIVDDIKVDMDKEIKELETRLCQRMEEMETRILAKICETPNEEKKESSLGKKLDKYKWFILGGLFSVGIVLGKTSLVANILSMFYYLGGIG